MRGLLTVSAPAAARTGPEAAFDPDRGWRLHHQVAVRPEPFGALLYHFGTRKLSFLKNRIIVEIVNSLADHPDVRSACRAAGIDDDQQGPYLHAFGVLVQSKMLIPADQNSPEGSTVS
ncbi:mycofactocin system protein MftB [Mycolicibacterium phocaicum]|nr:MULTISPECIES: mycofactocin biosynthesis chaperone MftB [Mycolicibacterium]BBZ57851.1 mycofactocin system protein MftB [Mycolicibacterium phocaicum]BCI79919.1 mycofactocin system protein MftB [Mycolicibacterium sp. TY66]BCJ82415.1 mycofactocin system protein MftB [Mycolicibacterium sp. TY81]